MRWITALATYFIITSPFMAWADEVKDRPNIVFILADDLGYGELGCYGQEKIKTPHLDRLAAGGMRFTQHYSGAPVCAPSRATLMTGLNLAHSEIRGNKVSGNGRIFPGQWPLSAEALTIAEVLRGAGYVTGAFGKWGLGPSDSTGSPIKQGFDRFFGYNCQSNAHSFYPPFLDSDEIEVPLNARPIPGSVKKPEGKIDSADYRSTHYAPDQILAEALKFLDQSKDKPFFLYLPFIEPHVAMQPPQEWINRYPAAWDDESQGGKGPYRGQNGYLPHDRPRAAYAAMISDLDEHVGTVLERLDALGLTEKTLIVFSSDNGTTHGASDPKFHVGGCDAAFFNSTAGLRGYKGSCYEGGLRVPCIARWPGKIQPGSVSALPSYFPDWFPTFVAVSGANLPQNQSEFLANSATLDGINLLPALTGKEAPERKSLMMWDFHNYGGIIAIREGKWKAIRRNLNLPKKPMEPWELYDLEADQAEITDLAATHPEIVKRLEKNWLATRKIEPDFPMPKVDGKSELP
jgi:arylsulfatase A